MGRSKNEIRMQFVQCRLPEHLVQQALEIVQSQPGLTMRGFVADALVMAIARRRVIKMKPEKKTDDLLADVINRLENLQATANTTDMKARKTEALTILISKEMGVQFQ